MANRTFRTEFPDFDPATMPTVPGDWTDLSWHNDVCPFFLASGDRGVFVDYADASLREFADTPRFTVVRMDDGQHVDGDAILSTDDWTEVLHAVAVASDVAL